MTDKVDAYSLRQCAGANIRRADRVITRYFDEALAPGGLLITQFTLLATISETGPVTVNRLAEILVMDRTTLTRNLGPLTRQGLVKIETGKDRRIRLVQLTPEGRQALNRALPLWQKAQARIKDALGDERFTTLLSELATVVNSVR